MLIWSVFAILTALAAVAVMAPYARARRNQAVGDAKPLDLELGGTDAEVYKDQLTEIERDLARGVVTEGEADAARLEVSRRLLRAAEALDQADGFAAGAKVQPAPGIVSHPWRARAVLLTSFVFVPLLAAVVYLSYGAPGLGDRPLADRLATSVENQDVAILVARVENALAENPDDARGWSILAPVYARQGRFADARNAYRQLIRIQGGSPMLFSDLGEIVVVQNQGLVTADAMVRFDEALAIDPTFPKARYYRALGLVQEGDTDTARSILIAMREEGGPSAPWTEDVDSLLANIEGVASTADPSRAPVINANDAAALAALPEVDRRRAIEGMVENLAVRLEGTPFDLAGWSQLVRSYVTLERREEAQAALQAAMEVFREDQPARLRLLTIAEELQLEQPL
ncbi:MAG: c-type cytochrome biogenesis protein CcmI [Pseudomonadota bacterium]